MKLTAEQRLERCHVQLMQHRDFCLFSGVFMVGKVTVNDKVRTASTNGRDVVYGRAFVDSLNDKELAFLVVHEAMHKSYRHMSVWRNLAKENPLLANMAMDYVINLEIRDTDPSQIIVAMPRDADGNLMGCLDERFRGMDTKQVYDILKEECEGDDGDEGEDGGGGGQPSDENGHGHGHNDNQSGSRGELDEHDWDGAGELTGDEKEELEREIDSALREGSILGSLICFIPRLTGNKRCATLSKLLFVVEMSQHGVDLIVVCWQAISSCPTPNRVRQRLLLLA